MTGWRIGWLATPTELTTAVAALQSHTASAPSSVSQRAALGARPRTLPGTGRRRVGGVGPGPVGDRAPEPCRSAGRGGHLEWSVRRR
nr:hypothetical protein [Streptomyces seoulensis]